jgi:hypothetical protein
MQEMDTAAEEEQRPEASPSSDKMANRNPGELCS